MVWDRYVQALDLSPGFSDFFDFDISEVVLLCEVECLPVVVVLENVSDSEWWQYGDRGGM